MVYAVKLEAMACLAVCAVIRWEHDKQENLRIL